MEKKNFIKTPFSLYQVGRLMTTNENFYKEVREAYLKYESEEETEE